jgi:hypothetical protein
MVDTTITQLLASNPVTTALTGEEPIETVVSSTSEAARLRPFSTTPIVPQTGANRTLALTDQGKLTTMSNAASNSVTVPTNAAVAFPIGATLLVEQIGTGQTSIVASGGVTIRKKASVGFSLSERYSRIVLHKVAINTWHLTGELTIL